MVGIPTPCLDALRIFCVHAWSRSAVVLVVSYAVAVNGLCVQMQGVFVWGLVCLTHLPRNNGETSTSNGSHVSSSSPSSFHWTNQSFLLGSVKSCFTILLTTYSFVSLASTFGRDKFWIEVKWSEVGNVSGVLVRFRRVHQSLCGP